MSSLSFIILIIVFFLTTVVGVVTGSNSLIAVPVMFQVGIDEKVAIATNMFGLTFMSAGATIPFVRKRMIDYRKVWPLVLLTIVSSAMGAALVGLISNAGLKLIVSVGMIAVGVFILFRRRNPSHEAKTPTKHFVVLTYVLAFLLGIYGGLFSGGYVTILTAVVVAFFGMSFSEAVASTKLINVFSSLIATIVFAWQQLIDYKLGVILGATMFAGAYVGAHYASRMNELWLRRIFLTTVFLLAVKTAFDLAAARF